MILSRVALPTMPTTKMIHDKTVFRYLNTAVMYVLPEQAGGGCEFLVQTEQFPEVRDEEEEEEAGRVRPGSGVMTADLSSSRGKVRSEGVARTAVGPSGNRKSLVEFDWQWTRLISEQDMAVINAMTRAMTGLLTLIEVQECHRSSFLKCQL